MAVVLHSWSPGSPGVLSLLFGNPREAAAAWRKLRPAGVAVLALPEEGVPRRPTPWERRHGRAFCTASFRASHAEVVSLADLPGEINSDYAVVGGARRRPAFPLAAIHVPARTLEVEVGPAPNKIPPAPGPEEVILRALLAKGAPVWERDLDLPPNWSGKRDRVIRSARRVVYFGHGFWALLGRDVAVAGEDVPAICEQAVAALDRMGPIQVSDLLARLKEAGGPAAGIDNPLFLAAILRRRQEVVVDERTGVANVRRPPIPLIAFRGPVQAPAR